MQADVDDVGFLDSVIDEISRRHRVDGRRIFITGMSNGAMMAHRAGIELPGRIAAIAPVAGGMFGDEPAGARSVSAIMINGMLDQSVPYGGGAPGGPFAGSWDGTPVLPALAQAQYWAAANACNEPVVRDDVHWVHVRYTCPATAGVELYGMKNGGHAWPGGERGSVLGDPPPPELDASRVIWEFFVAHPKRAP